MVPMRLEILGEAAGSAEVEEAAAVSSHGNRPVFPADTDGCQRRTMYWYTGLILGYLSLSHP